METRKTIKKSVVTLVCLILLASMFLMVACDEKTTPSAEEQVPSISIVTSVTDGSVVNKGDKITFVVAVSDNSPYTVFVDNEDVAKVDGNTLIIMSEATKDLEFKLVVRINRLPGVTKSVTFKMKAPVKLPTVSMTANKPELSRLSKGDSVTVNATASDGSDVLLSVSNETLAKVDGNVVTIIAEPVHEEALSVTATLKDYPSVSVTRQYYVKAPAIDGQVAGKDGNVLTTEAIKALGDKSITVNGVVTDYFYDSSDGSLTTHEYITKVLMEEGKWYGEWYATPEGDTTPTVISDSYVASESANYVGENGVVGRALQRVYIDKNNQVATKIETDATSVPYLWQNQHLWNFVEEFGANISKKFVYRPEEDVFEYVWKVYDEQGAEVVEDEYDYYLMRYISQAFTPMLEDTFENVYFKMENGKITQVLAKTMEETGSNKNRAYTEAVFSFENIGTTTVPTPQPYEHDSRNEPLATALEKMKNATSYTFESVDVATTTPTYDPSDYETSATTSASFPALANNGKEGLNGRITQDAVLLTRTGKYQNYSEGGFPYHFEYTGYKNNADGTYDYFERNFKTQAFEGKRKYEGSIATAGVLPSWDLSADVFKFAGSVTDENNKTVTKFVLRNTQIIEGAAREVCMNSNAKNAIASSQVAFTIMVDSNGNVVSTTFPYEFPGYSGYCQTTYSKVNSTQFTDEFDGYVERVLPEWNDLKTIKYDHKHTNDWKDYPCYNKNTEAGKDPYHYFTDKCSDHIVSLDVVIDNVFGDNASVFPSMSDFRRIFEDNINMAGDTNDVLSFFEYKREVLPDGTEEFTDFVTWTASAPDDYVDENGALYGDGFNSFFERLNSVMQNLGYTFNSGVSDLSGGTYGTLDRKAVYSIEGKLTIVYIIGRNNRVDVDVYNFGDYNIGA